MGFHIILELFECDREGLDDVKFIEKVLIEAARKAKATLVGQQFHKFSPHGVSGVVVIAESHFTIHTWPEFGYAAVDLFTCGDDLDYEAAIDYLKEMLRPGHVTAMEVKRGILDLPAEKVRHKPEIRHRSETRQKPAIPLRAEPGRR